MFCLGKNINASADEQLKFIGNMLKHSYNGKPTSIVFYGDTIHDVNMNILTNLGYDFKCIAWNRESLNEYRVNFDQFIVKGKNYVYRYQSKSKKYMDQRHNQMIKMLNI
jgi:hypothetical protein